MGCESGRQAEGSRVGVDGAEAGGGGLYPAVPGNANMAAAALPSCHARGGTVPLLGRRSRPPCCFMPVTVVPTQTCRQPHPA